MGPGLLMGAEVAQRQLTKIASQHGWQLMKAGILEFAQDLQAAQRVRKCLFQASEFV